MLSSWTIALMQCTAPPAGEAKETTCLDSLFVFLISRCHCSLEDKIQDVLNVIFQTTRKCEREQTLTPRPGDPGIPERPSWPGKPGNPRSPLTPSLPGRPGVAWMEKNKTKTLLIMMLKCNFETLKICRSKGSNTVHLWRFLFFPLPLL